MTETNLMDLNSRSISDIKKFLRKTVRWCINDGASSTCCGPSSYTSHTDQTQLRGLDFQTEIFQTCEELRSRIRTCSLIILVAGEFSLFTNFDT
ncbi:hypothetical protein GBA52_014595 [Prunus armeniaca]|nr:hypothetical protein GBA52_014595 [Prunus armeniaca]